MPKHQFNNDHLGARWQSGSAKFYLLAEVKHRRERPSNWMGDRASPAQAEQYSSRKCATLQQVTQSTTGSGVLHESLSRIGSPDECLSVKWCLAQMSVRHRLCSSMSMSVLSLSVTST